MNKLLRLLGLAFALVCLSQSNALFGQAVAYLTDPVITRSFKNQGAFSTTTNYSANDVVSQGGSLYYAPAAIAASTTTPPGNGWLVFGGASSGGGGTAPAAYSGSTTYSVGMSVISGGTVYASLTNGNTGNTPSSSPSNWIAYADAAGAAAAVQTASLQKANNLSDITSAAAAKTNLGLNVVPAPATPLADYNFLQQSGTILTDTSGNGNNGTLAGGSSTAPAWTTSGLAFNTLSTGLWDGTGGNGVQLPAALNGARTIIIAAYENPLKSIGTASAPAPAFPVFVTSSLGSTGLNLMDWVTNSALNSYGLYGAGTFGAGVSKTQCASMNSGLHVKAFTFGTGSGDLDHIYIDGGECDSYVAQGSSAGLQTSGNLYLGSANTGTWATNTGFFGTMYRAQFYSGELTAAQVKAASSLISGDMAARSVQPYVATAGLSVPTLHCIGDSITAGLNGTAPCSLISLGGSVPAFQVQEWGISSMTVSTISALEDARVVPLCKSSAGPIASIVDAGTNDLAQNLVTMSQTASFTASEVGKLAKAGCQVFVGTMISRGGTGTGGATLDSLKDTYDSILLSQAKSWGARGVVDYAANPLLGADGANTNSTYFNTDNTHPKTAGDTLMAAALSNSLNYYYGNTAASPTVVTGTTYSMLSSDRFTTVTPATSAGTALTLPPCYGPSGESYVINSTNSYPVTVVGNASAQLVNGSASAVSLPVNGTSLLTIVAGPKSTSGCVWAIQAAPAGAALPSGNGFVKVTSGVGSAVALVGGGTGAPPTTPATPVPAGHAFVADSLGGIADGGFTPASPGAPGTIPVSQGTSIGFTSQPVSGDCTMSSTGAMTCTKTAGIAFGNAATTNANAYDVAGAAAAAKAASAAKWSIISSKTLNPTNSTAALGTGYSNNQVSFIWQEIVPAGINPSAIKVCYGNYWPGNYGTPTGENPNFNNLQLFGSVIQNNLLSTSNPISGATNRSRMTWNGNQTYMLQPDGIACTDPIPGNYAAGSTYNPMTGVSLTQAAAPAAPTLTPGTSGFLSNGAYTLTISYVMADGSLSLPSYATATLSAGTSTQNIVVTAPTAAAGALGYTIYEGSTTLACDQGIGVIPFTTNYNYQAVATGLINCVNPTYAVMNLPLGPSVLGGTGSGAANNGEGYKSGIQVGAGAYVGANCCAASYGPLYILGNVPATSIASYGDSIHGDGLHDDAYAGGGSGGGYIQRAAANQTSNRYYQNNITPNWGFVGTGRFSETAATANSTLGQKRFGVAALASTVLVGYGINDSTVSPTTLTNLAQIDQNFLAAGVTSVIEATLLPHLSYTTDGYQTLANEYFSFPGAEAYRRQINNVLRGTSCNGTAITGETPFTAKATANYAYNTNWYAGGDGTTTQFWTACPINESGTTTVLVNGTSAPYTYGGTGTINNSAAAYAEYVTMTTAPASGATVTISYTPSPSMKTIVATSTNPLVSGGYFNVFDDAALVEYGPGGSLALNGGLWGPAGSSVLTGLTVTSTNSTNLINTGGWTGVTTTDQYRGYAVAITADSVTPAAVGETAEIVLMSPTDITINGWTPLSGGSAVTPSSSAVFSIIDHTDTADGTHPSGRPSMVMGAGLVSSGLVK